MQGPLQSGCRHELLAGKEWSLTCTSGRSPGCREDGAKGPLGRQSLWPWGVGMKARVSMDAGWGCPLMQEKRAELIVRGP